MRSNPFKRENSSKKTRNSWLGLTVGLAAGVVQAATPGNALFVLDNHTSMQDYPAYLPEAFTPGYYPTPTAPAPGELGGDGSAGYNLNTGCSDPALISAMSWFDKDSPDPPRMAPSPSIRTRPGFAFLRAR